MDKEAWVEEGLPSKDSSAELSTSDVNHQEEKLKHHEFNEQTHYVPKSTIITVCVNCFRFSTTELTPEQIFLACSTVDFLALMDQTTLAASLTIVSNALNAGDEQAWIAGAYFV